VDLSYGLLFSKLRYFRNHVNCILLQDSFAFGDIASYSVNLDRHLIRWRAHEAGSASLITDENSLMTAKEATSDIRAVTSREAVPGRLEPLARKNSATSFQSEAGIAASPRQGQVVARLRSFKVDAADNAPSSTVLRVLATLLPKLMV
jgi:hypothetical protein